MASGLIESISFKLGYNLLYTLSQNRAVSTNIRVDFFDKNLDTPFIMMMERSCIDKNFIDWTAQFPLKISYYILLIKKRFKGFVQS
jgi:hypothetical protein